MANIINSQKNIHRGKLYSFSLLFFIAVFLNAGVAFAQSFEPTYYSVLQSVLDARFTEVPKPNLTPENISHSNTNTAILIGQTIQSITIGTTPITEQTRRLVRVQLESQYSGSYDKAVARSCSALLGIMEADYLASVFDTYQLYKILKKNSNSSTHRAEMNELARFLNLLYKKMPSSLSAFLRFSGFKPLQIDQNLTYTSNEMVGTIELFAEVIFNNQKPETIAVKNALSKILLSNYYLKNTAPQTALQLLETIDTTRNGLPLLYYLKGQSYLYVGNYKQADYYYSKFLFLQPEGNFVKSALLRKKWIALVLYADGEFFEELIIYRGKTSLYTDKQANIEATKKYNPFLLQARILFDGGEYQKAMTAMSMLNGKSLKGNDLVEYYYRFGRIFQQMDKHDAALMYYKKVYQLPNEGGYFHKKSALESGRILQKLNDFNLAQKWLLLVSETQSDSYEDVMDKEADFMLNQLVGVVRE